MESGFTDIESISDLHSLYGCPRARHPLVSHIHLFPVDRSNRPVNGVFYRPAFYTIFYKRFKGSIPYGRSHYDFDSGSLMFTAPGQVMAPGSYLPLEAG